MEARANLQQIANVAAIMGGDAAKRYVREQNDILEGWVKLHRGDKPVSKAARKKQKRAEVEAFQALLASREGFCVGR